MTIDELLEDIDIITDRKGYKYGVVRIIHSSYLFCWKEKSNNEIEAVRVKAFKFPFDQLKELNIWDNFKKEIKQELKKYDDNFVSDTHERMAKARKARKSRNRFKGLPEVLECSCGREVKANYHNLEKEAETQMIPLIDFIKDWKCKKCRPTKKGK